MSLLLKVIPKGGTLKNMFVALAPGEVARSHILSYYLYNEICTPIKLYRI